MRPEEGEKRQGGEHDEHNKAAQDHFESAREKRPPLIGLGGGRSKAGEKASRECAFSRRWTRFSDTM
jgi:hypothetical protein